MTDSLLVGVLTAATALMASWLTARGTSRAAVVQARSAATFEALREERLRRRATYLEMLSRAHAFSEALWRMPEADAAPDHASRNRILTQIDEQAGAAMNRMTLAARAVLLDGPADVSRSADRVRALALDVQHRLRAPAGHDWPAHRELYEAAYQDFRAAYLDFIETARGALEVTGEPVATTR